MAFGVAPAVILFFYTGFHYGKFGVVVAGLYVVFGAIRLARFNVTTSHNEPNVFIGLPIPAAAVFIIGWLCLRWIIVEIIPNTPLQFYFF